MGLDGGGDFNDSRSYKAGSDDDIQSLDLGNYSDDQYVTTTTTSTVSSKKATTTTTTTTTTTSTPRALQTPEERKRKRLEKDFARRKQRPSYIAMEKEWYDQGGAPVEGREYIQRRNGKLIKVDRSKPFVRSYKRPDLEEEFGRPARDGYYLKRNKQGRVGEYYNYREKDFPKFKDARNIFRKGARLAALGAELMEKAKTLCPELVGTVELVDFDHDFHALINELDSEFTEDWIDMFNE